MKSGAAISLLLLLPFSKMSYEVNTYDVMDVEKYEEIWRYTIVETDL